MQWQQDLSLTHQAIADILAKRGAYAEALEHFQKRLALAQPIAAADPSNATLQRGLGYTHVKIGDLHRAQGATQRAIEAYRAALTIRAALAAANPQVSALALEMVFVRWTLADLGDDALANMEAIVATLQRLKSAGLLNPQQAGLLPSAEARLAKLKP